MSNATASNLVFGPDMSWQSIRSAGAVRLFSGIDVQDEAGDSLAGLP